DLKSTADLLRRGGVIAYPSESVFGIGCLPDQPKAVKRLLSIKRRSAEKGLILLGGSLAQLAPWIFPLDAEQTATISQPRDRATTWVVPARETTPAYLTGNRNTIAIRLTQHPLIQTLCETCNSAIISTSANLTGAAPAQRAQDIDVRLMNKIDLIIDQPCLGEPFPSQIIDLNTGTILRD
ncbi:unnamed protein product, partial [Cyprideis torosa]